MCQKFVSRWIFLLPADLQKEKTLGADRREIVNPHERSVFLFLKSFEVILRRRIYFVVAASKKMQLRPVKSPMNGRHKAANKRR